MPLRVFAHGTVFADQQVGSDPLVVALHGWGRDRNDWGSAFDGRNSLFVDLPGFGASPPPPAAWSGPQYAGCVAGILDELGADGPRILVGHSFGGRVATCLAAARPDLVDGLVLCGVPLLRTTPSRKPSLQYRVVRRLHRMHLISDAAMERRRQSSGSADYRAAEGVMRDVLVRAVNETYKRELGELTCPVAFLWGENDTAAPPAIPVEAAKLVPTTVEVRVVPDVGHDVHQQAPGELTRLVDAVAEAAQPST